MAQQAEFLKNVRENLNAVQAKATARLETLNGTASKAISEIVEKGKAQQKDLSEKLSKFASKEALEQRVKPVAEVAYKQVSAVREKASAYVNETSRGPAVAVAGSLRKVAARLETFGQKPGNDAPQA
jgi:hypothetical protein